MTNENLKYTTFLKKVLIFSESRIKRKEFFFFSGTVKLALPSRSFPTKTRQIIENKEAITAQNSSTLVYRNSFFPRIIWKWNLILSSTISNLSIDSFKPA